MLPKRIKIVNVGPYKEVELDLAGIPGELLAVCGLNGSGKTFLLECIIFALYRTLPSRGAIYKYCTNKNARVEFDFLLDGKEYQSTIVIDSKARKMEAVLACGGNALTDGKTSTYDVAITKLLGPLSQVLASSYGAQTKTGNFIELQKADRKELFIKMIGLETLQKISDLAKSRAASIEFSKLSLEGQAASLRETALREVPETLRIKNDLMADRTMLSKFEMDRAAAQEELSTIRAKTASIGKLAGEQQAAAAITRAKELEIPDATKRLGICQELAAGKESYAKQRDTLQQMVDIVQGRLSGLQEKLSRRDPLAQQRTALQVRANKLDYELDSINKAIADQNHLSSGLPALQAKAGELDSLRNRLNESTQELNRLQMELGVIYQTEQSYAEARLANQKAIAAVDKDLLAARTALEQAQRDSLFIKGVPCHGEGVYAECQFLTAAVKSSASIDTLMARVDNANASVLQLRQEMDTVPKPDLAAKAHLQSRVAELNKSVPDIRKDIALCESAVALLPAAEAAQAKVEGLAEQLRAVQQSYDLVQVDLENVASELSAIESGVAEATELSSEISTKRVELSGLAELIRRAEDAAAQINLIQAQLDAATRAHTEASARSEELNSQLAQLLAERGDATKLEGMLVEMDKHVLIMKTAVEARTGELARAEAEAATIEQARERLAAIEVELNPMVHQVACYTRIAKAFGPMEIQSFEIDCAGPEVSRIGNELLFDCFGPRYSIKLVTQELKVDGVGYKDEFDVSVHDDHYGHWVDIDSLSGGQKVIVSEALALAIALFNKEKNGIAWDTLFRDETAAALDSTYAPQYVAMLRAARKKGGFSRVLFISHQGGMKDLADSKIVVQDGNITVE